MALYETNKLYWYNRLVCFYEEHNPEKLSEVNHILEKYDNREILLFRILEKKYASCNTTLEKKR